MTSRDTEIERIGPTRCQAASSGTIGTCYVHNAPWPLEALVCDAIAGEGRSQPASEPTEPTITIPVSKLDALVQEAATRERSTAIDVPQDHPSLDVDNLSLAMNRAYTYGTGTAEEVAAEYQRLSQPADTAADGSVADHEAAE